MARLSPDVRRRRLSLRLRRLRDADGATATDVARQLGWATSTLTRLERNEWSIPDPSDVQTLLDVYGVTGEDTRQQYLQLVEDSRRRGWWTTYPDLPDPVAEYTAWEWEAATLRIWEPGRVPCLLQTPDYARATYQAMHQSADTVMGTLLGVHEERTRNLVHGDDPVHLHAIIAEEALLRVVGDGKVMRRQLEHLVEVSHPDHVRIHIVPRLAGALPIDGGVDIITYPEPLDPELAFLPDASGGRWINARPGETTDPLMLLTETAFEKLNKMSLSKADTRTLLSDMASTV
jgi:transcriptional regulator with XRE-family HTH domain